MGDLIMQCFNARTNAHVLHLKTRSYAVHKALDEFYHELVELTDALAEAYQGAYGVIADYKMGRFTFTEDPIQLVTGLGAWIEQNRYTACAKEDTALQNMIDEIVSLCSSTHYKLKFLK